VYNARVIKVMLASPSDIILERRIAREVIFEWNDIHSDDRRLVLLPASWETHSSPDMGDRPQEIINKQVLRDCDLLIAIFWTRLGSSTGTAISGTAEEIEEHLKVDKPAMIYFSSTPVHPDSVDGEQYRKLKEFKDSLRSRGLVSEYDGLPDFRSKLTRHLMQIVIRRFAGGELGGKQSHGPEREDMPHMSECAKTIIFEASKDPSGVIMMYETLGGSYVHTNQREFVTPGDARSAARWRGAVRELEALRLVEDQTTKGEIFHVTEEGYRIADLVANILGQVHVQ